MTSCFHCALPVPQGRPPRAVVLGAEREFCCSGCALVASTIAGAGLEAYYRTRCAAAQPPACRASCGAR